MTDNNDLAVNNLELLRSERINAVERCLKSEKFHVMRDVEWHNENFILSGSRSYFSWKKGFSILSELLVIKEMGLKSIKNMEDFFETCFEFAKKVNRVPLIRGLQFGYVVIPCVITNEVEPRLIEYVTAPPRKHWALFEFPVVHDTSTGNTFYFRDVSAWGAMHFKDAQVLVKKCVEDHLCGDY